MSYYELRKLIYEGGETDGMSSRNLSEIWVSLHVEEGQGGMVPGPLGGL